MSESSGVGTPSRLRPPFRVRVKICGVTRPEDAEAAETVGADAVGMVFAPGSKRRVNIDQAVKVSAALGPFVARVGVFVDAEPSFVLAAVKAARLDVVQLHGHEDAAYAAALREEVKVVRAVSFSATTSPATYIDYPADAVLLDGAVPGSGTAFDWADAVAWRAQPHLLLAGGLTPQNVAAAVTALLPHAVDVASGVESSPGVKSEQLMRDFVLAAHGSRAAS